MKEGLVIIFAKFHAGERFRMDNNLKVGARASCQHAYYVIERARDMEHNTTTAILCFLDQ